MKKKVLKNLMFVMLMVFFSAAVCAGEAEKKEETLWAEAGFSRPKIEWINTNGFYGNSTQEFTYGFDLTVVMFRDTDWTKKVIVKRLKKVAAIYARCGLRMGKIKLVTAGAPEGMIDFARPGYRDYKIARLVPKTARPILFFIRTIPKFNAYAWIEHSGNDEIPAYIKNTAWFSISVSMPFYKKIRHKKYVSEAHELGHILLDSLEHTPEGVRNVMSGEHTLVNDRFNAEQCRKLKESRLVFSIKKK